MTPAVLRALAVLLLCFLTRFPVAAAQDAKPATEPRDYSEEAVVVERMHTRARFENDGTGRREQRARIRVQSEAGVQAFGQLVFGYNSVDERLIIEHVRVTKPDGRVIEAPTDSVQDLPIPIAREAPVYTDYRQKHVTVPALRPGDTLEYHIVTELHTPIAPGQFWLEYEFQEQLIVLEELLELDVPRDRKLKLKVREGFAATESEQDGRKRYLWTGSNLERENDDEEDSAAAKAKKKRQAKLRRFPAVQMTTFSSWEEVGRWYHSLQRPRVEPSDAVRQRAAELVRDLPDERAKIKAIYDYVSRNFRYISLSFGVGRYQPHSAADVFANQYGDCKDKHTLLASMLEAVGLKALPVLIHSSRKIDPEVPSPSQFDHLISAVPLGEEQLWLDTTPEVAPFRLLTANLRKKQALVVGEDGRGRLMDTPAEPPFPNLQDILVEGEVSELGRLTAKVSYKLRGDIEVGLRIALRRTPRTHWKQLAQMIAALDGLRGEVSEFKPSDPTATDEPFAMEFQISQANFIDWSSKSSQVPLPLPRVTVPGVDEEGGEVEPDDEPLQVGGPVHANVRLRIQMPAAFLAKPPIPVTVKRDYGEYSSRYEVKQGVLTAERRFRIETRELPPERARDFGAFRRAVLGDQNQRFAVEVASAGAMPAVPASVKAQELYEAGLAALQNQRYRPAADLFRRVVELEPKHKTAWNNLGLAYLGLHELDQARQALEKQVELNPYDEWAYNNLGRVFWMKRELDAAAQAFQKQLEVNPLDRFAHANLGALYLEQRKYAEAVPPLERALSMDPDNVPLSVELGRAYLNTGKAEEALAVFDKAANQAPSPGVWNNIAYELSVHKMHLDRAQRYAESAIAATAAQLRNLNSQDIRMEHLGLVNSIAAYWDTLGWVYFQQGELDAAQRYIEAAWKLAQHGEVGDHLAQLHEKRGNKTEALRFYALALGAVRPPPDTRDRLAALAGEKKVEALVNQHREQLSRERTLRLGRPVKATGNADFFVVLAPGGTVEAVKWIGGEEALKPAAEALRKAKYPVTFPDDIPLKLVRRGTLSCPASGECLFVLLLPEDVRSVD